MTERPIIFNSDMVRAILRGEKTQTRRPVKPIPVYPDAFDGLRREIHDGQVHFWACGAELPAHIFRCPCGQPEDRLWVRETFVYEPDFGVAYRADEGDRPEDVGGKRQKWTPSIHMPRSLSRITLEITDINAARVQDITEDDARAEGVKPEFRTVVARSDGGPDYHIPCSYRGGFANTWNAIYAKRPGLSWDENPWIWAITFSVETSHEN